MTKREREQRDWMQAAVERLGFTSWEFHKLRRISMTLHRWHEHECNGNIQREGDDGEGKPRWYRLNHSFLDPHDPRASYRIPDRERGALKRLGKIIADRNKRPRDCVIHSYVQGDPRGAALYLVTAEQLRGDSIDSCYNRGVAVY